MRRRAAAAVLGGVLALALPVPAYACMPRVMPSLTPRDATVAPGATLQVTGDVVDNRTGRHAPCPTGAPATPHPEPGTPAPTQSPTPLVSVPPVTLPPVVPVAYAAPAGRVVTVTLRLWDDYDAPERVLARVPAAAPVPLRDGLYRHRFAATVAIPADVAPGRYALYAGERDGVVFGMADLTVTTALADTGSPAAGLAGLGVLSLVAGALVLELSRRGRHAAR